VAVIEKPDFQLRGSHFGTELSPQKYFDPGISVSLIKSSPDLMLQSFIAKALWALVEKRSISFKSEQMS